ncbi:SDR family oxidoreductase [Gryllotalpicola protaetiae]|uniref:SDR family oxidoreductase n=1 Tax=Gryllotalpicola protaetiae TaxID=2419771 RepID=A0A387BTG9_9MICO|nr:SDR family oxidoreductase [Gryllotalpicola protaetiae]AYG04360.1 SDR family oxidoreductase [Gryllotalpicola protaetiae]
MATKTFLFIGGTGTISASSVRLAVERGHAVTVLNRGRESSRALPAGVETLTADIRDPASVRAALGNREFDAVAEFLAFTPDHVQTDLELFEGRAGQYVFISSASAYQTPPKTTPVTESTPLVNPFWKYSQDKIACEDLLVAAVRDRDFPATIVRPSHTYDETRLPTTGGWTDVARMRAGKPVVVHGDGTSLWTITHSRDFAVAFVGLLGNPLAVGDTFHITGDHHPTWDQIYTWIGQAAGVREPELVHVASETIGRVLPDQLAGLIGDKAHSMVFDNSKVKALVPEFQTTVPYWQGAAEAIAWFDAHPEAQKTDAALDAAFDKLVAHARAL